MNITSRTVLAAEGRKITRAPVARIAALTVLILVSLISIGGYAVSIHRPNSVLGRKAAALVSGQGWDGYTQLAVLSLGVTTLLSAGIVMAWTIGREFTDGTVVGLFAIPPDRTTIAAAKVIVCTTWTGVLVIAQSALSALGGMALGLPLNGVVQCWLTLLAAGGSIGISAVPVMWVSTRWRGYLPGIGATLAVVVITNLASGLGPGAYLPWAIPMLWATPGSNLPATALVSPIGVGIIGAYATRKAWSDLQLGRG